MLAQARKMFCVSERVEKAKPPRLTRRQLPILLHIAPVQLRYDLLDHFLREVHLRVHHMMRRRTVRITERHNPPLPTHPLTHSSNDDAGRVINDKIAASWADVGKGEKVGKRVFAEVEDGRGETESMVVEKVGDRWGEGSEGFGESDESRTGRRRLKRSKSDEFGQSTSAICSTD
jgi:hypothetical protein